MELRINDIIDALFGALSVRYAQFIMTLCTNRKPFPEIGAPPSVPFFVPSILSNRPLKPRSETVIGWEVCVNAIYVGNRFTIHTIVSIV
jgi:hypothetical protein